MTYASVPLEVTDYYLNCRPFRSDIYPFRELVLEGQKSLEGAQHTLRIINSIASNFYHPEDVDNIVDGLFKELYNVEGYLGEVSQAAMKSVLNGVVNSNKTPTRQPSTKIIMEGWAGQTTNTRKSKSNTDYRLVQLKVQYRLGCYIAFLF